MKRAAYLLSIFIAITLFVLTASAVRPDPDGLPTDVSVGVRLMDLREISDPDQTMTVDLGVELQWKDPRLASLDGCEVPLDDVWTPGIAIENSGRLITSRPREVRVGPGGLITYTQRYFGSLATYHSLHEFPFDKQDFAISLISIKYGEDEVKLSIDEKVTGRRERLNISEWTIGEVEARIDRYFADAFDRQHPC